MVMHRRAFLSLPCHAQEDDDAAKQLDMILANFEHDFERSSREGDAEMEEDAREVLSLELEESLSGTLRETQRPAETRARQNELCVTRDP